MSVIDELLEKATRYAEGFEKGTLPLPPAKRVAVVACMDARLNPYGLLGLSEGDAHVIRNAGGVITADEIRSLATMPSAVKSSATRGSSRSGPRKRSTISRKTCANRSPASKRAPSSPRKTTFAASSTRSRVDGCAR
jgi:hypothetical protein